MKSFDALYKDNAPGIEIERLKIQVETLTAERDSLRADADQWRALQANIRSRYAEFIDDLRRAS